MGYCLVIFEGHVIPEDHLLAIALTKGPSGDELDFTYQSRDCKKMVRLHSYLSSHNNLFRTLWNVYVRSVTELKLIYLSIATPSWIVMHCGLSRVKTLFISRYRWRNTPYRQNVAMNVFLVTMGICQSIF